MATTKVAKAADIVLKNPEITNQALAKLVKTKPNAAWTLRQSAEKYIKRHGLRPTKMKMKKAVLDLVEGPSSAGPLGEFGGKIEVKGDQILIRIPAKSLGSIILSKLLH